MLGLPIALLIHFAPGKFQACLDSAPLHQGAGFGVDIQSSNFKRSSKTPTQSGGGGVARSTLGIRGKPLVFQRGDQVQAMGDCLVPCSKLYCPFRTHGPIAGLQGPSSTTVPCASLAPRPQSCAVACYQTDRRMGGKEPYREQVAVAAKYPIGALLYSSKQTVCLVMAGGHAARE